MTQTIIEGFSGSIAQFRVLGNRKNWSINHRLIWHKHMEGFQWWKSRSRFNKLAESAAKW